ncbi:MAG TPA: hypothetical protein VHO01_03685 [Jatrophihabitans sp.]|nr:hypothetical protein [Jatrophihabitans sp.]
MRGMILALAVVVAGAAGWLALRPTRHDPSPAQAQAAPSAAEVSAVMQLLADHAHALLARDRAGWDAGLDPNQAAADFAGKQRAVFSNLSGVPLTTWRYTLTAPVTDPSVLQPAANRLGGRVVILHVQLQYALAQVDPAPTSKSQYLTAVHRAEGWRLAADGDVADSGGPSWQGPWDFGPLLVAAGPHTLVLAHPAHRAVMATFQQLVERSIPVVASVWGASWNEHVGVLIPDTAAEFAAVTSDSNDTQDIAAVAVADSVNPDLSASPQQAVLGARIVLNPDNLSRLDAAGRQLVVQHELTHIATRAQTSDQMPTWLIEGFADYVGNLGSGRGPVMIAPELAADVAHDRLPSQLPASTDFDGANPRLPQAYEQSWLACRLIAATIGQHGLVTFYRAVASAARTNPATAVATELRALLHTSITAFTARWRSYLQSQLR